MLDTFSNSPTTTILVEAIRLLRVTDWEGDINTNILDTVGTFTNKYTTKRVKNHLFACNYQWQDLDEAYEVLFGQSTYEFYTEVIEEFYHRHQTLEEYNHIVTREVSLLAIAADVRERCHRHSATVHHAREHFDHLQKLLAIKQDLWDDTPETAKILYHRLKLIKGDE